MSHPAQPTTASFDVERFVEDVCPEGGPWTGMVYITTGAVDPDRFVVRMTEHTAVDCAHGSIPPTAVVPLARMRRAAPADSREAVIAVVGVQVAQETVTSLAAHVETWLAQLRASGPVLAIQIDRDQHRTPGGYWQPITGAAGELLRNNAHRQPRDFAHTETSACAMACVVADDAEALTAQRPDALATVQTWSDLLCTTTILRPYTVALAVAGLDTRRTPRRNRPVRDPLARDLVLAATGVVHLDDQPITDAERAVRIAEEVALVAKDHYDPDTIAQITRAGVAHRGGMTTDRVIAVTRLLDGAVAVDALAVCANALLVLDEPMFALAVLNRLLRTDPSHHLGRILESLALLLISDRDDTSRTRTSPVLIRV